MSTKNNLLIGCVAAVIVMTRGTAAETIPALPTIIQRVTDRDAANHQALRSLEYHQTLCNEVLDDSGKVTKTQELNMVVRPGASQEIEVVSEKGDDLPTNPDEASLRAQGKKAQSQNIDFSLKDIVNRYEVRLVGQDQIQNQAVYVLAFEPKLGQPYRNQTEKVLNHLHGRIWVSQADYNVLKTDATLAEPVRVAWIFARVSTLDFHYELADASREMGPSVILTNVKVDAPLLTFRQRLKINITSVEPRSKS